MPDFKNVVGQDVVVNGQLEAPHLHEMLIERWGSDIVSGRLVAGQRMSADRAATAEGVSRTVVREVVRVLEAKGLVEARRRVGITVLPESRWNAFDPLVLSWRLAGPDRLRHLRYLGELRSVVEPLAARLAAQRAEPAHCAALAEAVMGMAATARAAHAAPYLGHDAAFHTTLLAASGNPMLAGLDQVVVAVLEGRTRHHLMPQTANAEAVRLHGVVASAIQAGDPAGAEAAMRAIVAESVDAVDDPDDT